MIIGTGVNLPYRLFRMPKFNSERNPNCELVVDGGVRHDNVEELVQEGVDGIVVSSAIFKHPEGITAGVKTFRKVLDSFEYRS